MYPQTTLTTTLAPAFTAVAAGVVGGSVWVRLILLLAVLVAWALMLRAFGVPWIRITRY